MVESERVSEAVCRDFGEASRLGGEVALAVMGSILFRPSDFRVLYYR